MANTGKKITITLKEVFEGSNSPTGDIKPNIQTDPDYIDPVTDLTACPITYNTACPDIVYTEGTGQLEYEFALPNSVRNNPALTKVKIKLMDGSTEIYANTNLLSEGNYFTGYLLADTGFYIVTIDYLDNSDAVIHSCSGLASVNIV